MPATKRRPASIGPGAAFAKLISDARRDRGWSQDALAGLAGVNRSTVLRWEAGDASRPDPVALTSVCHTLEVSQMRALHALGYLDAESFQSALSAGIAA
jgi:transcriptional regulator with XRE-family HTH domain